MSTAIGARRAALLGLLQGPSELLPVSSSAHTILVPLLAGWPYAELDARLRKSFEVSLHAGGAIAMAIGTRAWLRDALRSASAHDAIALTLSCAPAAGAGLLWQRPIERRLSQPLPVALALAAGAAAMALADRRPCARGLREAGAADALVIGVAQAIALVPGISRSGAALTAARVLRFDRAAAAELAWRSQLPLLLGASVVGTRRAIAQGLPAGSRGVFAAGSGAAFCSTLACLPLLWPGRRAPALSLAPYALYRLVLSALALPKLARARRRRGRTSLF